MTNFHGIRTDELPATEEGAAERARRERLEAAIVNVFSRFNGLGRAGFERAINRAAHRGFELTTDASELFEIRRMFAFAWELNTAKVRTHGSAPHNLRSWFSVDHEHPLSRGGATNQANLRVVDREDDLAKGCAEGVEIAAIPVPDDFAIWDSEACQMVSSIAG